MPMWFTLLGIGLILVFAIKAVLEPVRPSEGRSWYDDVADVGGSDDFGSLSDGD